ncbi:WD repeat-containing protein 60-like isoform X2 [Anneissia japonica]|uniref:WD repeat-containing protein 60-like isoform X2 n=1 Tax=Anneissia japonica TaxID=1529436 RepID=UPI0014254DE0|nr:WD repeat-containing protein 60-like isoform X2 [Anneissia japonica]
MPSERRKKLVDTWGEDELKNSMKESRKERSKDSKSRRDGERDDRERRKRKEEKDQGSREKDRRETRDRENRREHRDDEKDDRRHREDKERRRPKEDDDERRRRKKEEERSKSGRHGNDKKKDDDDRERRKHRREEEDRDHEKDDKERRRRRRHEDDDERKDSGKRRERKHRDETEEERRKRKEKERERRHREKEAVENGSAHKDRRRSERRERDHDSDSRDRERRREDRKHREDQRKHEDNDENKHRERRRRPSDDDRDRRKQHKEEKDDSRKTGKSKEEEFHDEEAEKQSEIQRKEKLNNHEGFGQTFLIEPTESAEVINDEDLKPEKISEKQQQNLDEDEDNYDDDDFEDYDDDDFEDDNEDDESEKTPVTKSEYDELRRAMAEENEATLRRSMGGGTSSSSSSSRPTTSRTGRTFVNFVAAKQRQISDKVSQKTRKRGKELMALLDLDVVNFDLLDMAPVNEYDLYIRSFGQSNTKQAYVQCNEDNLEREIQTEEIEVDTKWTQHPADDSRGCGGEGSSKEDENNTMFKGEDSMRLARFLDKAANVISTLLEEEAAGSHHSSLQSSNLCFSRGFTNLTTNHTFLEGRDVLQVQFHPVQTNLLLTAHTLPRLSISKHPLSGCGLICLWNLNMPTKPQKVLSCQSPISCCCFSPSKTSSVFAGTEDGSVVAWDLREPSFMHSFYPVNEGKVEVQVPTYSTDGVSNEDNHHSCVVSIQPVVSITDSMQSAREEGLAFQLASMEQNGKVNFWVVMEIEKADIAGSEYDLGLVPGGKIKLMKSSFIMLKAKQRDVSHLSVSHLHFSQSDANHFYATTDAGYIMHCTRNGTADIPRLYHTKIDFPVDILAVDFHPFGLPYFLVGCRDGCIRMHHTKSEFPVITWFNSTNGMDLVSLAWSRSRPAVFFSIDVTAKMYIWDLLKGDSGPVRTEQFTHKQLTCLSLSNDHRATRTAISVREPEMALSSGKGTVEIHRLNEQFTKAEHGELSQCKEFLQTLM